MKLIREVFLFEHTGDLVCGLFVFRQQLAAWMPDGTWARYARSAPPQWWQEAYVQQAGEPDRAKRIAILRKMEDFLILEDSPYRHVSPGPQVPLLKALDTERRVVHLGSFSKTAFPAARLGYVVADQEVRGPSMSLESGTVLGDNFPLRGKRMVASKPGLSSVFIGVHPWLPSAFFQQFV